MNKKVVVLSTCDPKKDPEKASLAFSMAVTALTCDCEVSMFFTLDGVLTCSKGYVDNVDAGVFPPLAELLQAFTENGGKLFVCLPSMHRRKISEIDLIDGVALVNAPVFISEISENALISL